MTSCVDDDEPPFDYPEQADHVCEDVLGAYDEAVRARRRRKHLQSAQWAADVMRWLREQLAPRGECHKCGKRPRRHSLQIHHVDGRDWEPRRHNQWTRAARYRREFLAGVRMQALCIQCNSGIHPDGAVKTAQNRLNARERSRKAA